MGQLRYRSRGRAGWLPSGRGAVRVLAVFAAAALAGSGCGPDSTVRTDQRGGPGDRSTSSLPEPPPRDPPSPPATQDPELVESNPNRRDGGAGSLCWLRWEIARTLIKGHFHEQAAEAVARFSERLPDIQEHAAQIESGVPEDLRAFLHRLQHDLVRAGDQLKTSQGQAPTDRFRRVASSFDFENYPEVRGYFETASSDPDCRAP